MGLARRLMGVLAVLCVLGSACHAQGGDARTLVQRAVQSELAADRNDRSRWRFRDEERDKGTVSIVVQTDTGSVKRLVMRNGRPLDAADADAEEQRLRSFVHDPGKLAKQKRDGEADDRSATELINMLPDAFVWKIAGEDAENVTLHFEPNPDWSPPNMQARVLGAMRGELVVHKAQQRIRTIRGALTHDVTIGFGLLGRMKEGGTFRVERREVEPRLWQITETHVHIEGKALLFKSIGEQQDEIQSEFTPVPHGTTLDQAVEMSRPGR